MTEGSRGVGAIGLRMAGQAPEVEAAPGADGA